MLVQFAREGAQRPSRSGFSVAYMAVFSCITNKQTAAVFSSIPIFNRRFNGTVAAQHGLGIGFANTTCQQTKPDFYGSNHEPTLN